VTLAWALILAGLRSARAALFDVFFPRLLRGEERN
jgi:hypothetical protein